MDKAKKNWENRLTTEPADLAVDFVQSLSIDKRLYKYDIAGSLAHAQMLNEQKLITKAEFKKIKTALLLIAKQIECGKFNFDKTYEDIHMAIEAALIKRIGSVGKKLHTARSRNDQVTTDVRLWTRDEILSLQSKITALQKAFVKIAARYADKIMPAYTHLQRAQPVSIACYLLSFVEQLERDYKRLDNCFNLLNVSPLGSGAIAGTTLPIDRNSTAECLGFTSVSRNSIDAVSDRDFCAEFIFDCSMISMHLSRMAEDWIIYSSNEFGFIVIADEYCTSSSMMPQKKNPDMLELIRGKTGSVYGSLMAMMTILKAQPSGYNRDLQEDKIQVFGAADTVSACLDMAAALVAHTKFDTTKIAKGLDEGFIDATALAEYLAGKAVPFRKAHGIVGSAVVYCEKKSVSLKQLSLDEFRKFSPAIEDDVYKYIGAMNTAGKYSSYGGGGIKQAKQQIAFWRKNLSKR